MARQDNIVETLSANPLRDHNFIAVCVEAGLFPSEIGALSAGFIEKRTAGDCLFRSGNLFEATLAIGRCNSFEITLLAYLTP